MTEIAAGITVSVDGYIAGPNDNPDNPGGDGFDRLHEGKAIRQVVVL